MGLSERDGYTCESVTEGHPDKVADFISDSVLDAYLALDPTSRVACETAVKSDHVLLLGEITSQAHVDLEAVVREAVRSIGYTDPSEPFSADGLTLTSWLTAQATEIGTAVTAASDDADDQGAGDQGIMYGYACDETPELLPLPLVLAHRLAAQLAADRHDGSVPWLRPDGKTQVTVRYEDGEPREITTVVVSTQHMAGVNQEAVRAYVVDSLGPRVLGDRMRPEIDFAVNPSGSFVHGGPSADSGLTGRKIIVDTYGGIAHHGGGAFSGKDPSKVDRSGAYYCRYVARHIVKEGIARRVEVQVAYAIGRAEPVAVAVEAFGTGDQDTVERFVRDRDRFDFRPRAIVERLELLRPIYRRTTNCGHFGKHDLPWER